MVQDAAQRKDVEVFLIRVPSRKFPNLKHDCAGVKMQVPVDAFAIANKYNNTHTQTHTHTHTHPKEEGLVMY